MNLLVIIAWVVFGLVASVALFGGGVVALMQGMEWWDTREPWRLKVAAAGVAVLIIATVGIVWAIGTFAGGDDEASHCGPGTHYVYQDHLVGKTIDHEWMCTA